MAKTITDLINILKDLNLLLEAAHEIQPAADDLLAIVRDRIINNGIDANGQIFKNPDSTESAYSDKKVPVYFFKDVPTRGSNKTKVAELITRFESAYVTYANWREVNNLRTDVINFQFTGDMWRQTVAVVGTDNGIIVVEFTSLNAESKGKIENISNYYPGFMNPNSDEIDFFLEGVVEPLLNFLNKHFK
jgi:hypothetical protein